MSTDTHCEDKKLLILAVDGSKASQYAVDFYFKYLHHDCNEIVVLHCMEYPNSFSLSGPYGAKAIGDIMDSQKEASEDLEKKYIKQLAEHKANGRFVSLMCNDAGNQIVETAKEMHAFNVVMGSRGLGWLKRLVMGSVSNYVINHHDGAVCVVRPPSDLEDK